MVHGFVINAKTFYGIVNFQDHQCFNLEKVQTCRKFSWLVPVNGLLHLEINACSSFIKLHWSVFGKCLRSVLGFKSPEAQKYLNKGNDHHKTWNKLEILYCSQSLVCHRFIF